MMDWGRKTVRCELSAGIALVLACGCTSLRDDQVTMADPVSPQSGGAGTVSPPTMMTGGGAQGASDPVAGRDAAAPPPVDTDGAGNDAGTDAASANTDPCGDGGCMCQTAADCCDLADCTGAPSCVDSSCRCPEGTKVCSGLCVAEGTCCQNADCPDGDVCTDGACACPAGTHRCGTTCTSDSSADSCGTSCDPCPRPVGGGAVCEDGTCKATCPSGQSPCVGTCVDDSEGCDADCGVGTHNCSGICLDDDSVLGCGVGNCTACPSPPQNGYATCAAGTCGIACDTNYLECGDECIRNDQCCVKADCGSGGHNCDALHRCVCPFLTYECAGTCIPVGQCCIDADCGSNSECRSGGCVATNWCAQQTKPGGVPDADYRCVDFEAGLPAASQWARQTNDKGTLSLSTARAKSAPNSMQCFVSSEDSPANADRGRLSWTATGGTPIKSARVSLEISPAGFPSLGNPWTGDVDIVCLNNATDSYCMSYNYADGFFMDVGYSGGIAFFDYCPISASIPANVWTHVEWTISSSAAPVLKINGSTIPAGDCTLRMSADSSLTVTAGLAAAPLTYASFGMYFDNIEAYVQR